MASRLYRNPVAEDLRDSLRAREGVRAIGGLNVPVPKV